MECYPITVRDVTYRVPAELSTEVALRYVAIVNRHHPAGPATLDLLDPFGLTEAVLAFIAAHGPTDLVDAPWPYALLRPTVDLLRERGRILCIHPEGYTVADLGGADPPEVVKLLTALAELGPATRPALARRAQLRAPLAGHFLLQLQRSGRIERDGDCYRFPSASANSASR